MAKHSGGDGILDGLRVEPGSQADLTAAQPGVTPGLGREGRRAGAHRTSSSTCSTTCTTACGPRRAAASCSSCRAWTPRARTAPSGGCSPGLNPQGCSVVNFKAPDHRRPRPRLPLAHPRRHAGAGDPRGLEPVALRGRRHRPRASASSTSARPQRRYRHIREFERMLRRRGHHDGEGVPPPLQGGAAGPPPGADRRPEEELEVPPRPISTPAPSGTSTRTRYDEAITATSTDVGAVVRRPGRPQVGPRRRRGLVAGRRASSALDPQIPDPEPGLEGLVVE